MGGRPSQKAGRGWEESLQRCHDSFNDEAAAATLKLPRQR